ncbi:MAG: hypothetical protein E4H20_06660 [Spirochaetales bacterium]|nr:MAG: hypothetical protein E4H20_06660 [Spirochaetales bacterium]
MTGSAYSLRPTTTLCAAPWRDIGADYSAAAREIIMAHHERWDGTGYPRGLRGNAIPLGGRIMSIAEFTWIFGIK